jgi:NAD kinase
MEEINKKADIVITIGGDGTILRALGKIEKPIFAINSGGMGFLS